MPKNNQEKEKTETKRNIKDSVFTTLFADPDYTLRMYKEMHPEDTEIQKSDINIVTLKNVFVKDHFNDLGFMIKQKLIVLVEAQSTFSVKIALRFFIYLADSYERFIRDHDLNVYSSSKSFGIDIFGEKVKYLPAPELYVIYTGKEDVPDEIDFADLYESEIKSVSIKIKVIKSSGTDTITGQYIRFCVIADEERIRYGEDHKAAVQSVIQRCKQEHILEEFIRIHEAEVRRMLGEIFSEEYANEVMLRGKERERLYELNEAEKRGIELGEKRGIELGEKRGIELGEKRGIELGEKRGIELGEKKAVSEIVKNMIKENVSEDLISRFAGIAVEEIRKIAAETE